MQARNLAGQGAVRKGREGPMPADGRQRCVSSEVKRFWLLLLSGEHARIEGLDDYASQTGGVPGSCSWVLEIGG